MTTFDVLINGGGPVGMGLAIELGQRGHTVCVVERHHEPQPIPKGQNLTQRTAEHFLDWECEAALRTAHPIPKGGGIGGMTTYGTLLSEHHYDWLTSKITTSQPTRACRNMQPSVSCAHGQRRSRPSRFTMAGTATNWSKPKTA